MFSTEKELQDNGFILTPNQFHDGIGNSGKVYGKSFENEDKEGYHYEYFSVDSNGVVAKYVLAKNVVPTPEAPVVQDVVAPAAPEVPVVETPEVPETNDVDQETLQPVVPEVPVSEDSEAQPE